MLRIVSAGREDCRLAREIALVGLPVNPIVTPMTQNPPAADRVLILRLGAMGDVVRTLPAVAGLRRAYPGAHLAWLVEPASAGVVESSGLVDETLIFPRARLVEALREGDPLGFARRLRGFLEQLRERRFELTIDFHGLLKSGLLARLSGAPTRIGLAPPAGRELSWLFANRRVAAPARGASRFARNAALLEAVVPGAEPGTTPLLAPSPLAEARLAARLRATGREGATGFVLIHPGSSRGARHKRYGATAWSRVARSLAEQGLETWVAAGPNRHERSLAEEIVRRAAGSVVMAPETRAFDDLLALQARAAVFVSADSGPLHAASLAGRPVVQLVGPTDPVQNAPWPHAPSEQLHVPLPCAPCRRGCDAPACMRAIPPARVADRVAEICRRVATATPGDRRAITPGEPGA